MGFIRILFLIAIWFIPIIFLINIYLKMNKKEQEEFKRQLKRPSVLFGLGFPVIGMLMFLSGMILTVKLIQHFGATLVLISWFTTSLVSWKKGKTDFIKSAALILLGVIGFAVYIYLI